MSESSPENEQPSDHADQSTEDDSGVGISDSQLPEDLQPADDNPLAKPPSDEDDEDAGMSLGPDGPEA